MVNISDNVVNTHDVIAVGVKACVTGIFPLSYQPDQNVTVVAVFSAGTHSSITTNDADIVFVKPGTVISGTACFFSFFFYFECFT